MRIIVICIDKFIGKNFVNMLKDELSINNSCYLL